jgi:hypothetical protein
VALFALIKCPNEMIAGESRLPICDFEDMRSHLKRALRAGTGAAHCHLPPRNVIFCPVAGLGRNGVGRGRQKAQPGGQSPGVSHSAGRPGRARDGPGPRSPHDLIKRGLFVIVVAARALKIVLGERLKSLPCGVLNIAAGIRRRCASSAIIPELRARIHASEFCSMSVKMGAFCVWWSA